MLIKRSLGASRVNKSDISYNKQIQPVYCCSGGGSLIVEYNFNYNYFSGIYREVINKVEVGLNYLHNNSFQNIYIPEFLNIENLTIITTGIGTILMIGIIILSSIIVVGILLLILYMFPWLKPGKPVMPGPFGQEYPESVKGPVELPKPTYGPPLSVLEPPLPVPKGPETKAPFGGNLGLPTRPKGR